LCYPCRRSDLLPMSPVAHALGDAKHRPDRAGWGDGGRFTRRRCFGTAALAAQGGLGLDE